MAVYLCGASIDENGRATGGKAGDQTGREVRRIKWYLYGGTPWDYVIRLDDPKGAEKCAQAAEQGAASNKIGYDQSERNTLYHQVVELGHTMATVSLCETDCTAFAAVCLILGGLSAKVLYSGGNLPYSGNFDSKCLKAGGCQKLTSAKYLNSSDYLHRGDILVKAGHHAEVVVSDGAKVGSRLPKETERERPCVLQAAYNGTSAQRWALTPDGDYYRLRNASGKLLDVTGGSTETMKNGRAVYLHTENGTDAQKWKLIPSPVGGVFIASALDERYVLDDSGGAVGKRASVRLHKKQEKAANMWAQSWHILEASDGGVAIINAKSFYALDSNPTKLVY